MGSPRRSLSGRQECRAPQALPRVRGPRANRHRDAHLSAAVDEVALVSPPVALALDVVARILAEAGRADDEDLEARRPGLVASPRAGWDPYRVPLLEVAELPIDLHPSAPAHDHVILLLLLVCVAVRKAIAGRDALVGETRLLELECLGRRVELQLGRSVEIGAEILQVRLEVPESEWHGANPKRP